jgi:hypothetical protein
MIQTMQLHMRDMDLSAVSCSSLLAWCSRIYGTCHGQDRRGHVESYGDRTQSLHGNQQQWRRADTDTSFDANLGVITKGPTGASNDPRRMQFSAKIVW